MKLSDFNYHYPRELVAQRPLSRRDASRMMIIDRTGGSVKHAAVCDLPNALSPQDLLILNNSRVVPARLFGTRSGGRPIELLVVEPSPGANGVWRCLIQRAKRIRKGQKFHFGMRATATALGREDPFLLVEFKGQALPMAIQYHGVPPLPPYIEREGYAAYTEEDRERYQTIYAQRPGSAAAPTAGLHISEQLLDQIGRRGIQIEYITLHVGIDTFAPLRTEDIGCHRMHGERVEISPKTAQIIAGAKKEGRRVVAVGTTTTRAIEAAYLKAATKRRSPRVEWPGGAIAHGQWTTDLFIAPGFEFKVTDALLTNFHQPKSSLLLLVAAFAGRDTILSAYEEAIRERYRLFSYGDCMLVI
jgi:S-adenosylmethionine:tRNA ribosyltransferase-isomerase